MNGHCVLRSERRRGADNLPLLGRETRPSGTARQLAAVRVGFAAALSLDRRRMGGNGDNLGVLGSHWIANPRDCRIYCCIALCAGIELRLPSADRHRSIHGGEHLCTRSHERNGIEQRIHGRKPGMENLRRRCHKQCLRKPYRTPDAWHRRFDSGLDLRLVHARARRNASHERRLCYGAAFLHRHAGCDQVPARRFDLGCSIWRLGPVDLRSHGNRFLGLDFGIHSRSDDPAVRASGFDALRDRRAIPLPHIDRHCRTTTSTRMADKLCGRRSDSMAYLGSWNASAAERELQRPGADSGRRIAKYDAMVAGSVGRYLHRERQHFGEYSDQPRFRNRQHMGRHSGWELHQIPDNSVRTPCQT